MPHLTAAAEATSGLSSAAAAALATGIVGAFALYRRRWLIGIICTIICVGCALNLVQS